MDLHFWHWCIKYEPSFKRILATLSICAITTVSLFISKTCPQCGHVTGIILSFIKSIYKLILTIQPHPLLNKDWSFQILLIDSGGQYLEGTTDITRTFVLGDISEEERYWFTKALRGHIRLSDAHFLFGCSGINLDILARGPLWDQDVDYQCGTNVIGSKCMNWP